MTIKNKGELAALKTIGAIAHDVLKMMERSLKPGITTLKLDKIAGQELKKRGASSAPMQAYNFPGFTYINLNNEAAHDIPSDRILQNGDNINIDVSAEKNGYFADTGGSFAVGTPNTEAKYLLDVTREALKKALFLCTSRTKNI